MIDPVLESVAPIVNAEWVIEQRDQLTVVDARAYLDGRVGYDAYLAGHVAGARFLDLDSDFAAAPGPVVGRHPLPTAEHFANALARVGISSADTVVAYDDVGGMIAGRLVWMLRVLGQPAALLDGGIQAWSAQLETGEASPVEPAVLAVREWPADAIADADAVSSHIADGGVVIDSRGADRYRGEIEPIDPKAGHVPGASNLPFAENLVDGRFKPASVLAERFAQAAVDADAIVYCGSGVSACHNILASEYAGTGRPRLYVGSWSGWSTDPDRPVATG